MSLITASIIPTLLNAKLLNRSNDNDVVFFQDIFSCTFYRKRNSRIIMTLHCSEDPLAQYFLTFPKLKKTFVEKVLMKVLHKSILKSDAVVVLSESFKDQLIDQGYTNVHCVYNGIKPLITKEVKNKYTNAKKINFISVASLSYRKGFDILIEAFNNLDDVHKTKFHFSFVGDGDYKSKLKGLVKKYNLNSYFSFLGVRSDIEKLLLQNDAFILPSRDEGLPISMLEAMSVGLPCLLTNVGSIPEVLEDGSYVPMEPNEQSITNVLTQIANNKFNLNEIRDCATIQFNNKFTIESMINKYSNIINDK